MKKNILVALALCLNTASVLAHEVPSSDCEPILQSREALPSNVIPFRRKLTRAETIQKIISVMAEFSQKYTPTNAYETGLNATLSNLHGVIEVAPEKVAVKVKDSQGYWSWQLTVEDSEFFRDAQYTFTQNRSGFVYRQINYWTTYEVKFENNFATGETYLVVSSIEIKSNKVKDRFRINVFPKEL